MEGGLTVTDDEELSQILKCLRAHGWTRNLPKENKICKINSDDSFMESFRFVLPGYNLRPLELSGAIGLEQLKKLPFLVEERRKNGFLLNQKINGHPDLMIQKEIGESSWFGFSLIIRPESNLTRTNLLDRLQGYGFECRPIVAGNFARNDVMRYYTADLPESMPNADRVHDFGLFVGNHHYSLDEAIETLASCGHSSTYY